jgi:hypothetical protein
MGGGGNTQQFLVTNAHKNFTLRKICLKWEVKNEIEFRDAK